MEIENYLLNLIKNTPPTATLIFKDAREKSNIFKKIKEKIKTVTFKDVFLGLSVVLNIELFVAIFRVLAVLA